MDSDFRVSIAGLSFGESLCRQGPCLDVRLSLHPECEERLREQQLDIPSPQMGKAILDTGGHITHIDAVTIARLRLPQFRSLQPVQMTSGIAVERWHKGVIVEFPRGNFPPIRLDVIGSANVADENNLIAVIGRDVLQHFVLVYNGISGNFKLAVPDDGAQARTLRAV